MADSTPDNTQHETLSAWFLGPKAENVDSLIKAFTTIILKHKETRLNYYPDDTAWITEGIKQSPAFDAAARNLQTELEDLITRLSTHSVPWFSPRYNGHMAGENSIPGIVGYLAAMLGFNQNNVTFEVSPVTTMLEIEAGLDICNMVGYQTAQDPEAWGHITCDGSVANLESIWASRNLKFYPLSIRDAMETGAPLEFIASTFMIKPTLGEERLMRDLDTWELLNLQTETILDIPQRLKEEYMISSAFLDEALKPYLIQTLGKDALEVKWGIQSPQLFCTRTKHYSWPKGAAIAGIGSQNAVDVDVGIDACMNIGTLEELLRQNSAEKRAVYTVVAVIGTTEEGAVDDLVAIFNLREKLQQELGLSFVIHADAAWGAYFASTIPKASPRAPLPPDSPYVPGVALCPQSIKQLRNLHLSDSITVDPHKTAYTPYPAGGLCYRDGRMKNLLTWQAPYLHEGSVSIGTFGVEGSKPGASASSVWLTHKVMPLNETGLGALLREASFTSRRFAAHWAAMTDDPYAQPDPSEPDNELIVVPFNLLPVEWESDSTTEKIQQQKQFIRDNILRMENEDLSDDAMKILVQLGSNLNINTFVCNFRINGKVNTDVNEANNLNRRIYERLSITEPGEDPNTIPLYLSSTTFGQNDYKICATNFKKRLGLQGDQDLFVLRSVVMSPFAASSNFVLKLAEAFKQVLKEEVQVSLEQGAAAPDLHEFVVQGNGKSKYLVYQPMFNKLNSRYQVILNADVNFQPSGDLPVILKNKEKATLQDLCSKNFAGTITIGSETQDVQVMNIRRIKQGSLNFDKSTTHSRSIMPFYLYGDARECHLTHLLSVDPNIQLCASNVTLNLKPTLSAAQLNKGVIVHAHGINEASMQPFDTNKNLPKKLPFLNADKALTVTVYADPYPPNLEDIIRLPNSHQAKEIATGSITLGTKIYTENDRINSDPWKLSTTLSGKMKDEKRASWAAVVKNT